MTLFIWDFVLGTVMDQIIEWAYGQVVGFLADFFAQMGNMGVELFEMNWGACSMASAASLSLLSGMELRRYGQARLKPFSSK